MSPRILSTLAFVVLLNTASAAPQWIWLSKDGNKDSKSDLSSPVRNPRKRTLCHAGTDL
jgi:hypothetical protein